MRYIFLGIFFLINISFAEAIIKSNYPLAKNNFAKVITKQNVQRMMGIIRNIPYVKDVKLIGFEKNEPILYIERYPIIKSVHISGNKFYNKYELIPVANIRVGTPVKSPMDKKQKMIERFLTQFYKNNGFLKASVKASVKSSKKGYVDVDIRIEEGDLYFIRYVYVNGKKFKNKDLPIGEIADIQNINKVYGLLRAKYKNAFVYQQAIKSSIMKKPFLSVLGTQKIKHNILHIVGVFINDISKFLEYPISFSKAALGKGGVADLHYKIYQNPQNVVIFEGQKAFDEKTLRRVANIKDIDIFTLKKAKDRLINFYKDHGYLDIHVTYKSNPEYTKAIFYIDEGKKYKLGALSSNSSGFEAFIKKRYKDKYVNLKSLKTLIREYHKILKSKGYIYDFSYKINIVKKPDCVADLNVNINKGYRIILSKIYIKGTSNKRILDILKDYKTPREYKASDIENITDEITRNAKRQGYFDVSVKPLAKVKALKDNTYHYQYTFYVNLGKRYKNGNTIIYGYHHTLEHSIQYMASLGKYYNAQDEQRAISNLQESSIFNAVNIETFLDKRKKTVDRLIEVQEAKRGLFRFNIGYNTEQRLILNTSVGWSDLFGTPAQALFNYNISSLNTTYKLGINDKFLFSKDYFGSVFYQRDFEIHNSYYFVSKGLNFTLGRRIGRYYTLSVGYSNTRDYVYNAPVQDNGYSRANTISFDLTRDYKNHPTNPTRLGYDDVRFTESLKTGYNSFNINTYYLIHITDSLFYSFKFGFGVENDGYIYQRFFLGGLKDMMGYNFEDIGSPEGGKYYGFLRNEFDFPIRKPLNLALFSDIGNVSNSFNTLSRHLKKDVGVGVFVYTPVGPVRFDIAKPLSKIPSVQSSIKYYISVGYFY